MKQRRRQKGRKGKQPEEVYDWAALPPELLERIVANLRTEDVIAAECVNRHWHAVTREAVIIPKLSCLGFRFAREAEPPNARTPRVTALVCPADFAADASDLSTLVAILPRLHASLQSLSLRGYLSVHAPSMHRVASAVAPLSALTSLDLSQNCLSVPFLRSLAASLARLTALAALNVSESGLGADGMAALAPALGHLTALSHLDLSDNGLGADGACALAEPLKDLPLLATLNLTANNIGHAGMVALLPALQPLADLELFCAANGVPLLDLQEMLPSNSALQQMLDPEDVLATLKGFELTYIGDRVDTVDYPGRVRAIDNPQRVGAQDGVYFCGASILQPRTVDDAQPLVAALPSLRPALRYLNLNCFNAGAVGMEAIAPALSQLTALTGLHLVYNVIEPAGARALAATLTVLTALADLDLCENALGEEGATALAPALGTLTLLTDLHLSSNELGADGVLAIARGIRPLTGLQRLVLNDNNVDVVGIRALVEGLDQLVSLTALYLRGNDLGDAGVLELASVLSLCNLPLETLALHDNGDIGLDSLVVIRRLFPNMVAQHLA